MLWYQKMQIVEVLWHFLFIGSIWHAKIIDMFIYMYEIGTSFRIWDNLKHFDVTLDMSK